MDLVYSVVGYRNLVFFLAFGLDALDADKE